VKFPAFSIIVAAAIALAGCAANRALVPSAELPADARSSPQHYVVVTVRNPVSAPALHAASTPRGYDGVGLYVASRTRRAAHSPPITTCARCRVGRSPR
jgi:hypothetical protein